MTPGYPRSWLDKVPASVFGCLVPGELRVTLHPGDGFADDGFPFHIPVEEVPQDLRLPNTPIWIQFGENWKVLRIWRRDEDGVDDD
jgi:hypothetical protein